MFLSLIKDRELALQHMEGKKKHRGKQQKMIKRFRENDETEVQPHRTSQKRTSCEGYW